jgi:hypothetical protein
MIESRSMRWAEYIAHLGEMRNACRDLAGKPVGKKPAGRQRCRCDDMKTGYKGMG